MIVAYYTEDDYYTKLADKFRANLDKLELPYHITKISRIGKWQACAKFRPRHLLYMFEKYDNLLSIDVDTIVHKNPHLDFKEDLAIHYRNGHEPLAGTMYLKRNERTIDLMNQWVDACKTCQFRSGLVLKNLLKEPKVSIHKLPPQYAKIFDTMRHVKDPIIEHFQASRKARKK